MNEIFFWQKEQWQQCLSLTHQNKLPQALLFSGIGGLGKTQFANYFGQWLLCEKPDQAPDRPCQRCQACRWMHSGTHPEWFLIAPLAKSTTISVDQIRELTKIIELTPQYAQKKWIFIQDADKLTVAASNALLKILEEPTNTTMFILVSSQKQKLKETIRSRLTEIIFKSPTENESIRWLKEQGWLIEDNRWALSMAKGAPLATIEWLAPEFVKARLDLMNGLFELATRSVDPSFITQKLMKMNQNHALYLLYSWLSDLLCLMMAKGDDSKLMNQDQIEAFHQIARDASPKTVFLILTEVEQTLIRKAKVSGINDQLCFDNILINLKKLNEVCS